MLEKHIVRTDARRLCRAAIVYGAVLLCVACATSQGGGRQWAAHGYLSPGPTGDPEIIGVYDNEAACQAAANDWMTRQVVGNAIFADCYPVDQH